MTKIIQIEMCDYSMCPYYTLLACKREHNFNVAYCVYSHPFRVVEIEDGLFPTWCPLEGEDEPPISQEECDELVRKIIDGILE